MAEENISQEFRLNNIDETRSYLTEEINRNELVSKNPKNVFTTPNCIEHFFILGSTLTGCASDSLVRYSYRKYEFCSWIEIFCNNSSN